MTQRLFQDAGGTTPAIIAGQPVGLIRRLAGSVDALQATALSKPTLARWPKSGVRNLYNGAQGVFDFWRNTVTNNGLTMVSVGKGLEGGIPYIDYSINGTVGAGGAAFLDPLPAQITSYGAATSFSAAVIGRVLSGELVDATNSGLRLQFARKDEAGADHGPTSQSNPVQSYEDRTASLWQSKDAYPAAVAVRLVPQLRFAPELVVNQVWRIKGLMMQSGPLPMGALQFNYSPNDITEAGVSDLWHLYNDGGDSLNVTLPAGTYGIASIDINRAITITTITSDGTTPINTLRHERQLDVIIRAGAFTYGEEQAIRDYWGRVFA